MDRSFLLCPKCKCKDLIIVEVWTGSTIEFVQDGGLIDLNDGALDPGNPHHLEAKCRSCKHKWIPRKHKQIGLITIPTNEA